MADSREDLLRSLADAVSTVRSLEVNKAVGKWTLDDAIAEQILRMKKGEARKLVNGDAEDVGTRLSRYDRLTKVEDDVKKAIAAMRDATDDDATSVGA